MRRKRPSQIGATREERVRAMGFDPAHLTPEEQVELLDLCAGHPDPPRGDAVAARESAAARSP